MAVHSRGRRTAGGRPEALARGIGWLSLGLGVARIFAPRAVARITGVPTPRALMVVSGLKQLACGLGLLTQQEAAPWIRARIAGDAISLAALSGSLLMPGAPRRRLAVTAAVMGGITALDVYCKHDLEAHGRRFPPRHETLGIDVKRPADELYRFWRDVANLPLVLPHLQSVVAVDGTRSHWVARGAGDTAIEWDAEIIDDVPNERIAWRSLEGAPVFSAGAVQFTPTADGATRVRLELLYELPAGSIAGAVGQLFGRLPAGAARADLQAFRRHLEERPAPPPLPA